MANIIVPDELPKLGELVNVTYTDAEDVSVTKKCRLSYVFIDNATFDYKFIWQIEKPLTAEKALNIEDTTWSEIVTEPEDEK